MLTDRGMSLRHLTDFVAVRKPNIAVASMSQMTSLSADDVFNKLRFLAIAIAVLFGLMNFGAVAAAIQERSSRRRFLTLMQREQFGFTEQPCGAWTWEVWQDALPEQVGQVTGSVVQLCQFLGIPFVRFRAAVPEEWLQGNVSQSIGRKFGLSASALGAHKDDIARRAAEIVGGGPGDKPFFGFLVRLVDIRLTSALSNMQRRVKW